MTPGADSAADPAGQLGVSEKALPGTSTAQPLDRRQTSGPLRQNDVQAEAQSAVLPDGSEAAGSADAGRRGAR